MCPKGARWQRVKWGLFPNVDLVDFGAVDAGVNVALIVKANGGLDGLVNGELCGEVNTNANAILNAIPNAEGNGVVIQSGILRTELGGKKW